MIDKSVVFGDVDILGNTHDPFSSLHFTQTVQESSPGAKYAQYGQLGVPKTDLAKDKSVANLVPTVICTQRREDIALAFATVARVCTLSPQATTLPTISCVFFRVPYPSLDETNSKNNNACRTGTKRPLLQYKAKTPLSIVSASKHWFIFATASVVGAL